MVVNFSYVTQIHSQLFATCENGLSLFCLCSLLDVLPFILMLKLSHLNSSVCSPIHSTSNPILASVSLFPAVMSVQTQSSTSYLSSLFKDGCAGWRAAG